MTNAATNLETTDMAANLKLVPAPNKPKKIKSSKKTTTVAKKRSPQYSVPVSQLGFIDQVMVAFERRNLLATTFGAWMGGIVPYSVYYTAHHSVQKTLNISGMQISGAWLWLLVIAGLLYSAPKVYKAGVKMYGSKLAAVGSTILLEATLTFSPEEGLRVAALCTLIGINAIAAACYLVADRKESRKPVAV